MDTYTIPRVLISGSASGVGKSLVSMGIAYELRKRNVSASCCVVGPRMAQASILRRISGRYVRSLDNQILTNEQMMLSLRHSMLGSDLILIDGRDGLYDSPNPHSLEDSDAKLAATTSTPVVLVLDVRNFGSSIAALYKGYIEAAKDFNVAGAIFNHLQPSGQGSIARTAEYYRDSIDAFGLPAAVGAVPYARLQAILPPPGVSQLRNTTILPHQFFIDVEKLIGSYIDIDKLVEIASHASVLRVEDPLGPPSSRKCRIAVSDDSCFSVGYQDNLDLLRYFGAEIVSFSPLADETLPSNIGAVYLRGAFLGEYGEELAANSSMCQALREFADGGGVIYAEGSSSAFLCKEYRGHGRSVALQGVGIIDASAVAENASTEYVTAELLDDSVLGAPGQEIKGLCSREWRMTGEGRLPKSARLLYPGSMTVPEGYSPGAQIFCTFSFLHFGSNPHIAKNLVEAAQVVKTL